MPTVAAKHLQLDLRAKHCWNLSLTVTISPSAAKLEALKGLARVADQGDWPWDFFETYRVGGASYTRRAMLHPAKEASALVVHLDFSRGKHTPGENLKLSSLLQALSDPEETVDVECLVHFDFGSDEGVSTIGLPIEIPLRESGSESTLLANGPRSRFQVRGLRITQLDAEGSIDSSAVIDRPLNADFHVAVGFTRSSTISADLPGQLLNRASEIAQSYFKLTAGSGNKATSEKEE